MKKRWMSAIMLVSFFSMGLSSVSANTTVNLHLGASVAKEDLTIQPDLVTNLLLDSNGDDLSQITKGNVVYNLKTVDLTRYRQKVVIEYYTGNYNAANLIGSDSGYADYEDSLTDYIMTIPQINAAFNQTIPATDKLVNLDPAKGGSFGYVGTSLENGDTLTVKVLATTIKSYPISISVYQNKQDILTPNPIGMSMTDMNASTSNYWRVYTLSTSVSGVVGQSFDIRSLGRFGDTYTAGSRTGNLTYFGMYDTNSLFGEATTFTIGEGDPTRLQLAGFYYKDDIGSPVKSPGSSSGVTSGANIGFKGRDTVVWKPSEVTESLSLDNETAKAKLGAYPFNLDADPFDNPEFDLYWLSDNWILGHDLALNYYYDSGTALTQYYTVNFESNGGNTVAPILDVAEQTSIVAPEKPLKEGFTFEGWYQDTELTTLWNFDTDVVTNDLTLYAKWSEEKVTDPNDGKDKEVPAIDLKDPAQPTDTANKPAQKLKDSTSGSPSDKKTLPLTAEAQAPSFLLIGCLLIGSFFVLSYKNRNRIF